MGRRQQRRVLPVLRPRRVPGAASSRRRDGSETTYTNKGPDEIDGDAVVEVESKDDEGTFTRDVLVEGEHYLVKIERTTGANTGTVTFSGFNETVEAEAPADDEAVDLSTL